MGSWSRSLEGGEGRATPTSIRNYTVDTGAKSAGEGQSRGIPDASGCRGAAIQGQSPSDYRLETLNKAAEGSRVGGGGSQGVTEPGGSPGGGAGRGRRWAPGSGASGPLQARA